VQAGVCVYSREKRLSSVQEGKVQKEELDFWRVARRAGAKEAKEGAGRNRQGFSLRRAVRANLEQLCRPAYGFADRTTDVGGLAADVGVAREVFSRQCGDNRRLRPPLRASGNTERHICGGWPVRVSGGHAEARKLDRGGVALGPRIEAETGSGAFLFHLVADSSKLQAEWASKREQVSGMTVETGEREEALCIAVLRLAIGETGGASESAPICGAAICAEFCGKRFCGKRSKLSGKWMLMP
jgi:hypothetical protein